MYGKRRLMLSATYCNHFSKVPFTKDYTIKNKTTGYYYLSGNVMTLGGLHCTKIGSNVTN